MRTMEKLFATLASFVVLGSCLLLSDSAAHAATYVSIDVPGATFTRAYGINDTGQIVGDYLDSSGRLHGFRLSGGRFTKINVPGSDGTTDARGISDNGLIVGQYEQSFIYGFLRQRGSYTKIQYPSAQLTFARGINHAGQVVGYYVKNILHDPRTHGFVFSGGVYTTLDIDNSVTEPNGINNLGDIVGTYWDGSCTPSCMRGMVLTDGVFQSIDFPEATATSAFGISSDKRIVGSYSRNGSEPFRGFALTRGKFQTIQFPHAKSTDCYGVNSAGDIVGIYTDSNSINHGFLRIK